MYSAQYVSVFWVKKISTKAIKRHSANIKSFEFLSMRPLKNLLKSKKKICTHNIIELQRSLSNTITTIFSNSTSRVLVFVCALLIQKAQTTLDNLGLRKQTNKVSQLFCSMYDCSRSWRIFQILFQKKNCWSQTHIFMTVRLF